MSVEEDLDHVEQLEEGKLIVTLFLFCFLLLVQFFVTFKLFNKFCVLFILELTKVTVDNPAPMEI